MGIASTALIAQGAQVVGQAAGGLLGEITGSNKRAEKRQLENQMKLNESAAGTNYKYNEMAAEEAFARSMKMYDREFQDNTPEAQRKRLEEAGLNTALMYGGAGSTGGANVGQMAQGGGASGAAQAGQATRAAEKRQMDIMQQAQAMQIAKLSSEIDVNESQAELNRAGAKKGTEEATTTEQVREVFIEELRQRGMERWMENLKRDYEMTNTADNVNEKGVTTYKNKVYGEQSINSNAMVNQSKAAEIAEAWGAATNNQAMSELNTERKRGYWTELLNATIQAEASRSQADSAKVRAAAEKLSTEWKTGEYKNWKTWVEIGKDVIGAAL